MGIFISTVGLYDVNSLIVVHIFTWYRPTYNICVHVSWKYIQSSGNSVVIKVVICYPCDGKHECVHLYLPLKLALAIEVID